MPGMGSGIQDYYFIRRIAAIVKEYSARQLNVAKTIALYYTVGALDVRSRSIAQIKQDIKEAAECYPELGIEKHAGCVEHQLALLSYAGKYAGKRRANV